MLRLAERRPTASTDRASGELVDRTGIIAASVPRLAEDFAESSCESTQQIPVVAGTAPAGKPPRAVAVRRRARVRVWVGGGAAVLLVGFGWLAGGVLGGAHDRAAEEVAQADQRVPVAEQRIPVPSTVAPPVTQTAPPVTVYVPVPSQGNPVRRRGTVRSVAPRETGRGGDSRTAGSEQDQPRGDTAAPSPTSTSPRGSSEWTGEGGVLDWRAWMEAAEKAAAGR